MRCGSTCDVEQRFVRHDADTRRLGLVVAFHRGRRSATFEHVAELVAQLGSFAVILIADAGAANVSGPSTSSGPWTHNAPRESGVDPAPCRGLGGGVERNVVGNLTAFEPHLAGHDGAEIGIIDRWLADAATAS